MTDTSRLAAALAGRYAIEREPATPGPYLWAALHRPEFDALHGNRRYERLVAALRPAGAVEP